MQFLHVCGTLRSGEFSSLSYAKWNANFVYREVFSSYVFAREAPDEYLKSMEQLELPDQAMEFFFRVNFSVLDNNSVFQYSDVDLTCFVSYIEAAALARYISARHFAVDFPRENYNSPVLYPVKSC